MTKPRQHDREIERKFLLDKLPENVEKHPHAAIDQGYVAIPRDGFVVRLRRKGHRYFETVKGGGLMSRLEYEIDLSQEQYETLWPSTEGRRLQKVRYDVPYEQHVVEVDVYSGPLRGLVTAEVEFETESESDAFEPPSWFGREVTHDGRYHNSSLALHGLPPDSTHADKP